MSSYECFDCFIRANAWASTLRIVLVRRSDDSAPRFRMTALRLGGSDAMRADEAMKPPMTKKSVSVLMSVMREDHWSCSAAIGGAVRTLIALPVRAGRTSSIESCFGVMPPMAA